MKTPKITLGKETYTAKKPKAKMWRKVIKFNRDFSQVNMAENDEAYDYMLELIADCFGHEDIAPERIEDELDLDELMPLFQQVTTWIAKVVGGKAEQIPGKNVKTD